MYFALKISKLATRFAQPKERHKQICKGVGIQQHMRPCRELTEEFSFQKRICNIERREVIYSMG